MGSGKKLGYLSYRTLAGFGIIALASITGLLSLVQFGSPPVLAQQSPAVSETEIIGEPWVGEMGITETVDEIMARAQVVPSSPIEAEAGEREYPDCSGMPMDPNSPMVSQWPPPDGNGDVQTAPPVPPGTQNGGNGPLNPQTVGTSFLGVQLGESGYIPPDSMGAVGPSQILCIENGRIKVFTKTGTIGPLNTTTDAFFNSVRNSSGTSDPRVRFDRTSNRWIISMVNVSTPNRVLLAVSSGPTITGAGSFTFFYFQFDTVAPTNPTDTGGFGDYDTLAVDANAVYVGVNVFNPSYRGTTGFVVRKSSILGGGPIVVTAFRQLAPAGGDGPFSPSGADNWDPAATEGYFVGVSNAFYGRVIVRRVSNPGGTPTISGNLIVSVPSTYFPLDVSALGSTGNPLSALGSGYGAPRHYNAMIKQDRITGTVSLWMAHTIRTNSSGVGGSTGDRDASRWYQLGTLTGTPTLLQAGTLFDTAPTSPRFFWFPSVAQTGQGHMALGCSAAGLAERAEIAVAGRLSTDPAGTTQAPTTAQTSSTNYNVQTGLQRWGDYSHTCVDPTDDQTLWTFQEYCNGTNSWGVRAIKLIAPPPATPVSCSPATVNQGQTVNVIVTGTSASGSAFYDTDASYTQRLVAAVGGAGVTVNSVAFNTTTQFTMNITVAPTAPAGARTVSATNPDLQVATSATGILTVNAVQGCRGDFNCDHAIDFTDIDAFVAVLSGGQCCDPTNYNCDVNGDGLIDFGDIDPFVALLSAGATCP